MVQIYRGEIVHKLRNFYPMQRMPLLYSLNRSFGWRIISEDHKKYVKGIRSDHFDINEAGGSENYLTSMSMSEEIGITAIGSGSKEGCIYFIKEMSSVMDMNSGPRLKPIHKEVLNMPIYSLDWSGKHLLVGTHQGLTIIYKVEFDKNDQLQNFTLVGQYRNSPSKITIHAPACNINTHVKAVEFAPNYNSTFAESNGGSSQFISTTVNHLTLWDALKENEPLRNFKVNETPLTCASWSPNDPQSLIVCSGYDKKLSIIDTRISTAENPQGIVWSTENAHDRPITDAKFNPFIPYWLASSGEDAIVNIWDVRASHHAPVAKIDGNEGIVTSICWSNIRPENIGTTASDGVMRYWTLIPEQLPIWDTHYRIANYSPGDALPIVREHEKHQSSKEDCYIDNDEKKLWKKDDAIWNDENDNEQQTRKSTMLLVGALGLGEWGRPEAGTNYKGENVVNAKGSVISVKASKTKPGAYYSITSGGQFTAHIVRFDAARDLRSHHRFNPKDKDELATKIEDAIYCRRIGEAQNNLQKLKDCKQGDIQAGK
ncbi:MAG: WD40-repeat-containing domain protein [Benjaminiella poitrasii]|nr:MAG: WD40-repeat-containing domain protein [Benjaminiella poitrasii]